VRMRAIYGRGIAGIDYRIQVAERGGKSR
jgi:hypothetical protein